MSVERAAGRTCVGRVRSRRTSCRAAAFLRAAGAIFGAVPAIVGPVSAVPLAGQSAQGADRSSAGPGLAGREEVLSVEFTGNRAFSDQELRSAIVTRASACPLVLAATTCALGIDWGRDRAYFSPRMINEDAERLRLLVYGAHGFRRATVQVELTHSDEGVSVEFRIDEGEPYRVGSISFSGDSVPAELEADARLPIGVGDPLSLLYLREASDTLAARLRNSGYASAEVFLRYRLLAGADTATVTYQVERGPLASVGPVRVSGNRLLSDDAILDHLPFREGERYSERQIFEAQRGLHELDIVARASVRRDTSAAPDSVVPIVVEVEEGDPRRVRAGGGLNSAECINVEGRWASRNFFGGGRILQARARVSNLLASALHSTFLCSQAGTGDFGQLNWLASVDFTEPAFLSRRTNLLAGVFAERQSQKNIFVREAMGMEIGLIRNMGRGAFLNLRFRPELSRLEAAEVTLCATFLACAPAEIDALADRNWLAPVALSVSQDRADDLFAPRRGYRALVDLEYAGGWTGSDYSYARALADGSFFREIDASTVLALRLRAGRIRSGRFGEPVPRLGDGLEVVPSQKRFYGGGAGSVRGFAQSTLGPRSLSVAVEQLLRRPGLGQDPVCPPDAVRDLTCDGSALADSDVFQLRPVGGLGTLEASAELRFDFSDGLFGGAAFVDVGQVWQAWPRGMSLDDLEVSPGLGIRYNTVFGPIRLDVAYAFRGQEPLRVVTSQIRPFVSGEDDLSERIDIGPSGVSEPIDWVVSDDLALLESPVFFGDDPGFSLRRFQLHFSIGQAF